MTALPQHVALVAKTDKIAYPELLKVAAAINLQVTRDFAPAWGILATVDPFPSVDAVPATHWLVIVQDDINEPSAAGYHTDDHGQPYSLVQYSPDWSLTASHETLEMLGDPFGNRLVAGQSPKRGEGAVKFLVEVCDPPESRDYAYRVDGVLVSDFYLPAFLTPTGRLHAYDFMGEIARPHQVLAGGYLSWINPRSGHFEQKVYFGRKAEYRDLGPAQQAAAEGKSLREFVDSKTEAP